MSTLEEIEQQVAQLDAVELAKFRDWFLEFEADAWDSEIVRDATEGKLAQKALDDHRAGRTKPL